MITTSPTHQTWAEAELNYRHEDFQSSALPLSYQPKLNSGPTENRTQTFCVQSRCASHYHYQPKFVRQSGLEPVLPPCRYGGVLTTKLCPKDKIHRQIYFIFYSNFVYELPFYRRCLNVWVR